MVRRDQTTNIRCTVMEHLFKSVDVRSSACYRSVCWIFHLGTGLKGLLKRRCLLLNVEKNLRTVGVLGHQQTFKIVDSLAARPRATVRLVNAVDTSS